MDSASEAPGSGLADHAIILGILAELAPDLEH